MNTDRAIISQLMAISVSKNLGVWILL